MASHADCVFCKIVAGEIPSTCVLDTEHAFAFLDINPLADGHTLLIPKEHFTTVTDMTPEIAGRLFAHLPTLVKALRAATGTSDCNVLQNNGPVAGQVVGHMHIHIIPRAERDDLGYRWKAGSYPAGRAETLRNNIRAALNA